MVVLGTFKQIVNYNQQAVVKVNPNYIGCFLYKLLSAIPMSDKNHRQRTRNQNITPAIIKNRLDEIFYSYFKSRFEQAKYDPLEDNKIRHVAILFPEGEPYDIVIINFYSNIYIIADKKIRSALATIDYFPINEKKESGNKNINKNLFNIATDSFSFTKMENIKIHDHVLQKRELIKWLAILSIIINQFIIDTTIL